MVVRVSVRSVWTAETKSDVAIDEESIEDGAGEAGGGGKVMVAAPVLEG